MSSKSNRRKITVEKSGQRPSVFERLGTKAEQRDQSASISGYCRHWKNTGNCPFGSSCKNAMHHTLISPSKQRAASKDKEHSNLRPINKSQSTSSSLSSQSQLHSTVIPVKESGTPPRSAPAHSGEPGIAGSHWEEDWNERNLEHADEKELERRRQQIQRELELQMKKEMRKRKISTSGGSSTTINTTTTKKAHRSSSSSSSTSSGSSSSSTGSTSEASSSSRGRRTASKSHSSKQQGRMSKRDSSKSTSKGADPKKSRDVSKESSKKRLAPASSRVRSNSRSRQRSQTNVAPLKRRRNSTSPDSSGSDKRKQGRSNTGQHQPSSSRIRGRSPSPERKLPPERKRPALSHDKPSKRRDASPPPPPPRKSSLPPSRGGATRKRSASPPPRPPRRRSPSPPPPRSRSGKRHGSTSRNASPVPVRRRSPSVERKDTRRGHTPPSPPADRSYTQRAGGRNSRRNSPETTHRNQPSRDARQRVQPSRDSRQSPDRRPLPPRAASREPLDNKRADWGRGRDYGASSPQPRGHHRSSPDSSNGSTTRVGVGRDLRGDKIRPKDHDRDRERRRDAPLPVEKGRDKVRSRAEEGELPSLLSLMTQHPGHFTPQPQSSRPRALPRDEPQMDHRSTARDRNRFERYESDRGGDAYVESDDHHRVSSGSNTKRGPPPRRELSPLPRQPRPAQKSREWGEFSENRGRDWDRRSSTKASGGNSSSMPLRQWGPVPGSEDQPRQNRMLPPLSVRNAMQAARRAGASSPNGAASQQSTAPGSPQPATPDGASKGSSESVHKEKSSDEETNSQKDIEQEMECTKEVSNKRTREVTPEKEETEPARKRQCMEEPCNASPVAAPQVAAVSATSGLDLMESDLSDISDDADDILNAEGVEEPGEIESEEKSELQGTAACEEEEEEEPVEDLLDTLDFEEISDGELEAEEARGGVDALTVDWAALMSQTRSREGDETKEARTHRWQGSQLLSRLGVSMKLCGPALASKLGIVLADDSATEQKDGEVVKLLDPVAGVHVALRARRQQRESLFQLRDRRGLSAADDLAFRRQLNGLPAKKPGHQFNQTADPGLFHQAMQMLLAK